jgi:gamma-glutamyltranspeptidase/glutathione hydrolase/leukotriene-C4 hydrolase
MTLWPTLAGTSHIAVLAPNGDAVSVTSTINTRLGSGILSRDTGIILNNQMDDFSTPGLANVYGIEPSVANYIAPGRRPVSSMSPTIVSGPDGNVRMVVGASGGPKIITGTVQVRP